MKNVILRLIIGALSATNPDRPIQTITSHRSKTAVCAAPQPPALRPGPYGGQNRGEIGAYLTFALPLIIMRICRRHAKLRIFTKQTGSQFWMPEGGSIHYFSAIHKSSLISCSAKKKIGVRIRIRINVSLKERGESMNSQLSRLLNTFKKKNISTNDKTISQ